MNVKVKIKAASRIIQAHGLDRDGDVQRYWTEMVNRRITRYMPFRTGVLATKLKRVTSPTEITVTAPYARYQYYGKVMVNAATGKGPMVIPGVGPRWPKGATLRATARDLQYDTTKNPNAGPYWDRRLGSAEKTAMVQEITDYIKSRKG